MAHNYGYKAEGTILNGFLVWLQNNKYEWYKENIKNIKDLNTHLINIRIENEPNKPASKYIEKNAVYVSKKIGFKAFKNYFNTVNINYDFNK